MNLDFLIPAAGGLVALVCLLLMHRIGYREGRNEADREVQQRRYERSVASILEKR